MIGSKIELRISNAIKSMLGQKDFRKIALEQDSSLSTINNIVDRRQNITKNNIKIYDAILKSAKIKSNKINKLLTDTPF
tara:strand:+ start:1183 stop:1419 length:237 start_codon:yes stop_codon:yes gene_type:complete